MLRFFNAANGVTLVGLGAALACALLAVGGRPAWAIVALIGAGLADFLDGAVGRMLTRTDEEKTFGARLDSIADACSFGMAPAVLFWSLGAKSVPEAVVLFAFAAAAVWRLAYFDTIGLDTSTEVRRYTGLPTTFVALVVPLVLLLAFVVPGAVRWLALGLAGGLAVAMVSTVKIPKPGGAAYAVLPLLAVVVGGIYLAFDSQFPGMP